MFDYDDSDMRDFDKRAESAVADMDIDALETLLEECERRMGERVDDQHDEVWP